MPRSRTLVNTLRSFGSHHGLTYSAALAYFFFMALLPFLIFVASAVAYLPIPNLFERIMDIIARVAPQDSLHLIENLIKSILRRSRSLLSIGLLAAIWAASGGFDAMITALNAACGVKETRPFWKVRLIAIGHTFLIGGMIVTALTAMVLGPHFGREFLGSLKPAFAAIWPLIRWIIILGFTLASVEIIYFTGPNVRQHFRTQIKGAIVAVSIWICVSLILSWYLHNFAHFHRAYGVIGAVIALLLWFQLSGLAILFGAELNAELHRPPAA